MDTGFVLHRRRYRETSLIVDFLTAAHGRVSAVARGALRRHAGLAATLQPHVELRLELRGRGELLNLIRAEPCAGPTAILQGERLYALFYVNEIVMRLTAPHDPNPSLFETYQATLCQLAGATSLEALLRRFETQLLDAVGLGLLLTRDAETGQRIEREAEYRYLVERGPLRRAPGQLGLRIRGATLLGLAEGGAMARAEMREAKRLMRYVLDHHLDGRPLASRKLFETPGGRNS